MLSTQGTPETVNGSSSIPSSKHLHAASRTHEGTEAWAYLQETAKNHWTFGKIGHTSPSRFATQRFGCRRVLGSKHIQNVYQTQNWQIWVDLSHVKGKRHSQCTNFNTGMSFSKMVLEQHWEHFLPSFWCCKRNATCVGSNTFCFSGSLKSCSMTFIEKQHYRNHMAPKSDISERSLAMPNDDGTLLGSYVC